jgi:hypothetical protein
MHGRMFGLVGIGRQPSWNRARLSSRVFSSFVMTPPGKRRLRSSASIYTASHRDGVIRSGASLSTRLTLDLIDSLTMRSGSLTEAPGFDEALLSTGC